MGCTKELLEAASEGLYSKEEGSSGQRELFGESETDKRSEFQLLGLLKL